MKIKTTLQIFQENEIIEPTEDEYGREGRGIPLKYCNPETKNKKWVSVNDILKVVAKEVLVTEINKVIDIFVEDYSDLKFMDTKRLKGLIKSVIIKDQRDDRE